MTQPRHPRRASYSPRFAGHRPPRGHCSVWVLSAMGLLGLSLPALALAQAAGRTVNAGALPVPRLNGLVSGQAVVNSPVPGAGRRLMTIDQSTQRAILDWNSFDIGSQAEVIFRQPGSTSSTLNRIHDANPSVIEGRLSSTGPMVNGQASAGGQIILINQNGILFNRGAQVNTQSLVASTLNLSNSRFLSGALTAGGITSPAFEGGYDDKGETQPTRPDGTQPAAIQIGTGGPASAAAPALTANAGGSIMLIAPNVENKSGVIVAPDGQVILAAGTKVYLALNDDEGNTTLRGFRVEVEAAEGGSALNLSSLIRNAGDISADRGNVTLAALAVNQQGRVSAKTAVQNNGSIYLKARTLDNKSGTVLLAEGSVTEVQPDIADKSTIPESESFATRRGVIEVDGRTIDNRGKLLAGGGRIVLRAVDDTDPGAARVYLGSGSETSVAGVWADVAYADNFVTFRVTSNELKNSPDQKNGILRGSQVTVDLRQGSSILDLAGYIGAQARTVSEKAATGGELNISSSGSVIQRAGATIDASGGGYRYGAGVSNTSKLLGDDGKIYDIGTAPQARRYTEQLDNYQQFYERWNQTENFLNPLGRLGVPEAGYLQGVGGGAVTIVAPSGVVLDGTMKGGVTVGPRQMARAPLGGTLTIGRYSDIPSEAQLVGGIAFVQKASDSLGADFGVASVLSEAQSAGFQLAAETVFGPARVTPSGIEETSFGSVELNSSTRISVPADVHIDATSGASLTLRAPEIALAGSVRLPAGQISVPAPPTGVGAETGPPATRVVVGSGASLSTAGAWINNSNADGSFVGAAQPSARLANNGTTARSSTAGGSILLAGQSVLLERGAVLDVGGGAAMDRSGRIAGGAGGTLTLANGQSTESTPDWLQADLRGFGLTGGGQLVVSAPRIVVESAAANGTLPANTTRIGASVFSDNGFSSVRLNTVQGLDITGGTTLRPQQKNLLVDPLLAKALPTGGNIAGVAQTTMLPAATRNPVNLTFSAADAINGKGVITVAETAAIFADPKAKVSFLASNGLTMNGTITAPGGDVALTLNAPIEGAPTLTLGSSAKISTAGTFVPTVNDRGLTQGAVVGGGTVTIDARNAGVDLKAGSSIDVSGRRQVVDVAGDGQGAPSTPAAIDAAAGTVIVKSQGAVRLDGELLGHSPSATSAGGSFALELVAPERTVLTPATRRVIVTSLSAQTSEQEGFVDANVAVGRLAYDGFDKLRVLSENNIEFRGSPTLDFARGIRLDAPLLDVSDTSTVKLTSSTVSIGQSLAPRLFLDPYYAISPLAASPVLATRAGTGTMAVKADTVDIFGNLTVNGAGTTTVEATHDIRLIGRAVEDSVPDASGARRVNQVGSFTTEGNLVLQAAQVYPTTRTAYSINIKNPAADALVPGGSVTVSRNASTPGDVYSAAGKLRVEADTIIQGGRLKAPLGEIELRAGSLLELSPGSVTSVSTDGLTIPYGTTSAGVTWSYNDGSARSTVVSNVSNAGKTITLSGPTVDIKSQATVDLRGGGDVLAIEFVPGNGGDADTTLKDNTFAIIPKSKLTNKPVDADIALLKDIGFGFGSARQDVALYDSISIGSGGIVQAGEYVLLPARYALLPDAYLVQLQTGAAFTNLKPGDTTQLLNGATVVAGVRSASGTSVRESQSVGVLVRPGSAVRTESDYTVTGAQFFANAADLARVSAQPLPQDAGRLAIDRVTTLTLAGTFETGVGLSAKGKAGNTALVDISGPRIAVVDRGGNSAFDSSYLQLEGASLSALGGSVLIGGTRAITSAGVTIATEATNLIVANSAAGAVKLPELILAAKDNIEIRAGASLAGMGSTVGSTPAALFTEGPGALVRLSNAGQTTVQRNNPDATTGQVTIARGATVTADSAVLIDASKTLQSQGSIVAGVAGKAGGSLSLASTTVSLGEVSGVAGIDSGLVLSNADLARYSTLDALVLKGYGGIDFYGSTTLGGASLKELTLDTNALRGRSDLASAVAPASTIQAGSFTFLNSTPSAAQAAGLPSSGTLEMNAERINFGAGDKTISGWSKVSSNAAGAIVGEGTGNLNVGSDWILAAQRVQAAAGSHQVWKAIDDAGVYQLMTVSNAAAPSALAADADLGGRLALEGRRIEVSTTVQALSGHIALTAHGSAAGDDVTLNAGGKLDARGAVKDFNGTAAVADGGVVTLTAARETGKVNLGAGALLDVSAASGGSAGAVRVSAGELSLAGELRGAATGTRRSGSAQVDLDRLADSSALNGTLNASGFTESRSLRVRTGNIDVKPTDVVMARDVSLAADVGQINVAGTVGSGSAGRGATIGLYAGNGVTLEAGSRVNASGNVANADGGDVHIVAQNGALNFDKDATIDVRKGQFGRTGSVTLTLPRGDDNALGAHRLEGSVLSQRLTTDRAATVVVEGQRVYNVDADGASAEKIAGYAADHVAFVANTAAATIVGTLKGDGGGAATAVLRGATELRTVGDLAVSDPWNLADASWLQGGEAGTLSLRAGGNLTISSSIGSIDNNILSGVTWNLRMVAGADLTAADPLNTLALDRLAAEKGDLLLSGANAKLRTGTGRIDLAAARDVNLDNVRGVVYTAGRIGATDIESNGNNRWGVDGGDITVRAGRDVLGPVSPGGDLWITDWLRRPRLSIPAFAVLQPTDWWAFRPNFQQGLGTLGGGNIEVVAARDVSNLSAMLPTTGRTYRDDAGARQVDVQGGGDLRISAGNDISGGAYLVGRGEGWIEAAGDAGSGRGIQLYMMGASSGDVPGQSSIDVSAGRALKLQSINNPTILAQFAVPGSAGPSFGTSGLLSSFFTYSDNSMAGLQAKGGDLTLDAAVAVPARTLGRTPITDNETGISAFPASLSAVAFGGSVGNSTGLPFITYPSPTAKVQVLAEGSITLLGLTGSDRDPATLPTPTVVLPGTLRALTSYISTDELVAAGPQARIRERAVGSDFVFDIQALTGSIGGGALDLPAKSRVRAGLDIVGTSLTFQNLAPTDVSEVRAEQGDIRPAGVEIRGQGRLLLQAGRDIDLGASRVRVGEEFSGGLVATGNNANPNLASADSARVTLIAGVNGDVDLSKLDASFAKFLDIAASKSTVFELFKTLDGDTDRNRLKTVAGLRELAALDNRYASFVELGSKYPQVLAAYQATLNKDSLPLGGGAAVQQAEALYKLLNASTNTPAIINAKTIADLAALDGGSAFQPFVSLDTKYPRLFAEFKLRLANGVKPVPVGLTSVLYADVFNIVIDETIPYASRASGGINSYLTSIQTFGGSGVDLWAPNGSIVVGLTTPSAGTAIGVITNAGGAIRSVVRDNFNINQGKVLTAQGGDVVILSSAGNIDAGRGAKTSLSTPPPRRTPIFATLDGTTEPVIVGYAYTLPASASGSGIQTLTSDPDGLGPLSAPKTGNSLLLTPAGVVDAGEAGIRSDGNVFIDALAVRNGSNIAFGGTGTGVPVAVAGSLASSLATAGTPTNTSKAAEDAGSSGSNAARAAAAAEGLQKPTILTVEVLGFGDKNCKEKDKDCFAK